MKLRTLLLTESRRFLRSIFYLYPKANAPNHHYTEVTFQKNESANQLSLSDILAIQTRRSHSLFHTYFQVYFINTNEHGATS